MCKKYFIKYQTVTNAERMADKYDYLAKQQEWKVENEGTEDYPEILTMEQAQECWDKAEEYRIKRDKIRNALANCNGQGTYKAEWKYIEILKEAEQERLFLDSTL